MRQIKCQKLKKPNKNGYSEKRIVTVKTKVMKLY